MLDHGNLRSDGSLKYAHDDCRRSAHPLADNAILGLTYSVQPLDYESVNGCVKIDNEGRSSQALE